MTITPPFSPGTAHLRELLESSASVSPPSSHVCVLVESIGSDHLQWRNS